MSRHRTWEGNYRAELICDGHVVGQLNTETLARGIAEMLNQAEWVRENIVDAGAPELPSTPPTEGNG